MRKTITALIMSFLCNALYGQVTSQITINGTITDQESRPVAGALVKIEHSNQALSHLTREAASKKDGSFNISLDHHTGEYLLWVKAMGFQEIIQEAVYLETGVNNLAVKLIPISIFSIDVTPSANHEIQLEHVELSQTLTHKNIDEIPVDKSDKLQSFIGIMPGVVSRPDGKLFFDGSPADQNNYLLESFDIADPISYHLKANIGVEAVDSFDRFSGRYSPEFGKGSGGTLIIFPKTGDNRLRYNATNFFPGIEFNKGIAITNWQPRLSLSGSPLRNRLFLSNQMELRYNKNIITELPKGHDRTTSISVNDLLHIHANLRSDNILTSNVMLNYNNSPLTGLSPLNPPETTTDQNNKLMFFSIKNQIFKKQGVGELGYGFYGSSVREKPQGQELLQIRPSGNQGNAPFDIAQRGQRHHLLANFSMPKVEFWGHHRVKIGTDMKHSSYDQDIRRTGFEHFRLNGSRSSRTVYGGNGRFDISMLESSGYLQNEWSITNWLFAKGGIRLDRDSIVAKNIITPRLSMTAMIPRLPKTKVAAGIGWIPSASYLRLFSRNLDQYAVTTNFGGNGEDVVFGPARRVFAADYRSLSVPKTSNMSIGLEQGLTYTLDLSVNYLKKRTSNGYTYVPGRKSPPDGSTILFSLENYQTLEYDSVTVSANKRFQGGGYATGSYTYSRGTSNAALEINIDEPIIFSDTGGRLSWDTPHRQVSYGYFPFTDKYALAYFAECRSGLPFTASDEDGRQVGAFNGRRFPVFLGINLHVERKTVLFGHRWALRAGFDNILGRDNPLLVNANTAIPGFPVFYGIQPRKFVFRIRWLGKI